MHRHLHSNTHHAHYQSGTHRWLGDAGKDTDLPLAIIDSRQGMLLSKQERCTLELLALDAKTILNGWWSKHASSDAEQITWLHTNHLGAPQAATDQNGHVVWRARYAPFGAAKVSAAATDASTQAFTLHLRLPGQYEDQESGLHYNHQRYYDPSRGEYLTPDPLGTPDGPNPYAYVRYNPLRYVDPDGLVLFAFDGTENTDEPKFLEDHQSSLSNVVQFRDLYNEGNSRYITGVGTVDRSDPANPINAPALDSGFNFSGPARISRMEKYFKAEADLAANDQAMDVDIIGFSRGAAQARDFSNRIVAASTKDKDGNYWYAYKAENGQDGCQKVNFRFMGLWDTVLSTNSSGYSYNLGIPASFQYVAQAVALNDYRGDVGAAGRASPSDPNSLGAFHLESIMRSVILVGQTRVEMGFIGAHADIGGGFANGENTLSKVALAWMLEQAKAAHVPLKPASLTINTSPVIHDKSNNIQTGEPSPPGFLGLTNEDRLVNYKDGTKTRQRQMTGTGLTYSEIVRQAANNNPLINYTDRTMLPKDIRGDIATNRTGTVNAAAYITWLRAHGYGLANLSVQ